MSLSVSDPRGGRSHSRSRERSRSRSRAPSPPKPPPTKSKKYYESDTASSSSSDADRDIRSPRNQRQHPRHEEPGHRRVSPPLSHIAAGPHADRYESKRTHETEGAGRYLPEHERSAQYARHTSYSRPDERPLQPIPGQYKWDHPESQDKSFHPPPPPGPEHTRHMSINTSGGFHADVGHGYPQYAKPPSPKYAHQPTSPGYSQTTSYDYNHTVSQPYAGVQQPQVVSISSGRQHYATVEKYKYATPPAEIKYVHKPVETHKQQYVVSPHAQVEIETRRSNHVPRYEDGHGHKQQYATSSQTQVEIETRRPLHNQGHEESHKTHYISASPHAEIDIEMRRSAHGSEHDRRKYSNSQGPHTQVVEIHPGGRPLHAPPSPGLGPRMHRLSVSGSVAGAGALSLAAPGLGHSYHQGGGLPPGSPLLESYHGTWSQIGDMPSPVMLGSSMDDDLSDLEPLEPVYSSDDSHHHRPQKSILKKRVSIYDPEPDALSLAAALKHSKPESGPIIHILPNLSDDHIMALRTEYKKHIKVGGKGINIAKHIKLKVTGNLGKIAYATALGRWEGEAHWANFWYQSGTSRRELLIESLMGRTNAEIRAIKAAFSDKRYNDSLKKCMEAELKKDKFRRAVLLVLEEKRMEEKTPLSRSLIKQDVSDLYKALVAKEGGETAMIDIIVVRSDHHLREVLKEFDARYRKNFAKEMLVKSRNLVVCPPDL